jgi:ribosomal protein S18 acetylase RimI-like enzyme
MQGVSLRLAVEQDEDFQLRVYASTRADELALTGWPEAAQAAFARMQFAAQGKQYTTTYPGARVSIILVGEEPAGRLIVYHGAAEIRVVDIALLPEFRGQGIGEGILRDLQAQARAVGKALRLSVLTDGRARRLYERLGFVPLQGHEIYTEMEWVS